ncbi:TAFII28-domain-containing protein [Roridomyces roridus]|uniref:TAFII28-domain-containing protein n=1 Tax=Roridomyces roridus TaxID=1738132 RepID=A0AAD7F9R4_9AGAR|nr:TAFII28-domain-containing protein [Roridomyces roridus]
MSSPGYFSPAQSPVPAAYSPNFTTPAPRGRPRGGGNSGKRGGSAHSSPAPSTPQFLPPTTPLPDSSASILGQGGISAHNRPTPTAPYSYATMSTPYTTSAYANYMPSTPYIQPTTPSPYTPGLVGPSGAPIVPAGSIPSAPRPPGAAADEDDEGDDELFPAMAEEDYSAQYNFNTQSKDNLKVLLDNFTPEQNDRYDTYRRYALPKQAVRKVIQQTGMQVSLPLAQIVAGFGKVFVGEIVEKARAVQARRGETGPLSPDHLREAYHIYQNETGRVGAARPVRAKKLFVK